MFLNWPIVFIVLFLELNTSFVPGASAHVEQRTAGILRKRPFWNTSFSARRRQIVLPPRSPEREMCPRFAM